jgi:hypothetical protein
MPIDIRSAMLGGALYTRLFMGHKAHSPDGSARLTTTAGLTCYTARFTTGCVNQPKPKQKNRQGKNKPYYRHYYETHHHQQ